MTRKPAKPKKDIARLSPLSDAIAEAGNRRRGKVKLPASHTIVPLPTPQLYADVAWVSPKPLLGTELYKPVHKIAAGDLTYKVSREDYYDAIDQFFVKKKNIDAYNKACSKAIWTIINEIDVATKKRIVYAFDLTRVLCGVPFGYEFLNESTKGDLGQLGAKRKTMQFYGVWKHDINDAVILELVKPMWKWTESYSNMACLILDNADVELYTVSTNYWIVKADDKQRVEDCRAFGLRCCPNYKLVKGLAKKSVLIPDEQDYKNWRTDCWKLRGAPVWYQQQDDKIHPELLAKLNTTLRFP